MLFELVRKWHKQILAPELELGVDWIWIGETDEVLILRVSQCAYLFQLKLHLVHDFFTLLAVHCIDVEVFDPDGLVLIIKVSLSRHIDVRLLQIVVC